jgi:hypothetical protein
MPNFALPRHGLRLFLPGSWTDDPKRMARARVPKNRQTALTKPEIAIEEIDRVIASGTRFGWRRYSRLPGAMRILNRFIRLLDSAAICDRKALDRDGRAAARPSVVVTEA